MSEAFSVSVMRQACFADSRRIYNIDDDGSPIRWFRNEYVQRVLPGLIISHHSTSYPQSAKSGGDNKQQQILKLPVRSASFCPRLPCD